MPVILRLSYPVKCPKDHRHICTYPRLHSCSDRVQTVVVEPLDEHQQRHLAALREGVTIRTRRGAFIYGFAMGGLVVGGAALGVGMAEGAPWPLLVLGSLLTAVVCGAVTAQIGPERVLHLIVRSQTLSKASTDRAVSGFQIDGGRAWKVGEKPPTKYWDSWK